MGITVNRYFSGAGLLDLGLQVATTTRTSKLATVYPLLWREWIGREIQRYFKRDKNLSYAAQKQNDLFH